MYSKKAPAKSMIIRITKGNLNTHPNCGPSFKHNINPKETNEKFNLKMLKSGIFRTLSAKFSKCLFIQFNSAFGSMVCNRKATSGEMKD